MAAIHLIKKHGPGHAPVHKVPGEKDTYTSGYWTISEKTAQLLVGGDIYLHERQLDKSFYGGRIIQAWIEESGEFAGKAVFKFVFSPEHKGVATAQAGWGQEMKLELPPQ